MASRVTGLRKDLHQVGRQPDLLQLGAHAVDSRLGGSPRRRRWGDDDGIAALERHHRLVDRRGRRIGRRRDGADHAHRLGVFDDAFLRNFLDDACRFHSSRSRSVPKVFRWFLMTLLSTSPMPVTSTAISASRRALLGLVYRPGQRGYGLVDASLAESIDFAGKFAHGTARLGDQRSDCIGLCVAAAHAPVALGCFDFGIGHLMRP